MPFTAHQTSLLGLLLFAAAAAAFDYKTGHIPNWLVLCGAAFGLAFQVVVRLLGANSADWGTQQALFDATLDTGFGFLLCSVVPLILYRLSAMGGGDVKLLASIGIWGGASLGLQIELYAFVAAAVYAPARMAYQGRLLNLVWNSAALLSNPFLPKARRRAVPQELLTEIRFAPAVFVGTFAVILLQWSRS